MPGSQCPNCGKATFFVNEKGGLCNNCGYKMKDHPNGGKGGKGKKCPICKKFTLFGDKETQRFKCTNCGADS